MIDTLPVYIGWDDSEPMAFDVARSSLLRHSSIPLYVRALDIRRLATSGLLRRPVDMRGQRYDIISNAPAATDFAISRFLVPMLVQSGWALFVDSDVVFMDDVAKLVELADPRYAVMCVKHDFVPTRTTKMDRQTQTVYARKGWSSVMLWNCDHDANRRLSLVDVQERRGLDLHGLYWLNDAEIGELPGEWNWLVNEQPRPASPKIAHFTNGGPFTPNWKGAPYDEIWNEAASYCFDRYGARIPA